MKKETKKAKHAPGPYIWTTRKTTARIYHSITTAARARGANDIASIANLQRDEAEGKGGE